MPDETRTYWLSFVSDDNKWLGGCIVDVTAADAAVARKVVRRMFPHARPGAEWLAAAAGVAGRAGCNPGGELALVQIKPDNVPTGVQLVKNTLLTHEQLIEMGYQPEKVTFSDPTVH